VNKSDGQNRDVTSILEDLRAGDDSARNELFEAVYGQLHAMARARWAGVPPRDTLQPTALVHEAFAKMVKNEGVSWESRRHFFATASLVMQSILVRQARRHTTLKRGEGYERKSYEEIESEGAALEQQAVQILEIDEALDELVRIDPERADVVRMRYFGGLRDAEIAELLGVSIATVGRRWASARAWLAVRLDSEDS